MCGKICRRRRRGEYDEFIASSKAIIDAFKQFGFDTADAEKGHKSMEDTLARAAAGGEIPAKARQRQAMPASIEELLESTEEAGTHSILDVDRNSDTPGFAQSLRLSNEELIDLFGTTMPDKQQVDDETDQLFDLRNVWEGVYILVHENEQPTEILFIGKSGD